MPNGTVNIKPLTGALNTRSTPDEVPMGGWRWMQNFRVTQKDKLCRVNGYTKLLDREDYNNQDLHDQLFGHMAQPITLLYDAISTYGQHKLIYGTQNRIYALNFSTGNSVIISDQLGGEPQISGCPEKRFKVAQVEDTLLFTNGVDKPVYYIIDQPPLGEGDQSVATIPDLDKIGLSKASVVASWKGLMILANVVSDGIRVNHRIVWSDFSKPQSWFPGKSSVAGYADLGSGEDILGIEPLGDVLLVYTTGGIWQGSVVGGTQVLSFQRRYAAGERRNRCLGYPGTLVSTGQDHFYLGQDGIYVYNMFLPEPSRVDWIHGASSIIYDDMQRGKCAVPCGGFNASTKEIWFSWASDGSECPNKTLVINAEFPFVSYYDQGFSAFCNYVPSNPYTLRQFILDYCICSSEQLATGPLGFVKEGGYCSEQPPDPTCDPVPSSFWTTDPLTIEDVTTEDYNKVTSDEDSLCTALGGKTFDDLCSAEALAAECESDSLFLMASGRDYCVKQVSDVFYRELCTNRNLCGTYVTEGYTSIARSGPMDFKAPHELKRMNRLELEAFFPQQTIPSDLNLRVGYAARAVDPNTVDGVCDVRWVNYRPKAMQCLTTASAQNPGRVFQWPVFAEGDYLYFEFTISNPRATPVDAGGESCFSRLSVDIDKLGRNNNW